MNRIEKICLDTTNKYIYNIIREQKIGNLIDKAKKYTDYQFFNEKKNNILKHSNKGIVLGLRDEASDNQFTRPD